MTACGAAPPKHVEAGDRRVISLCKIDNYEQLNDVASLLLCVHAIATDHQHCTCVAGNRDYVRVQRRNEASLRQVHSKQQLSVSACIYSWVYISVLSAA
jgi:hypothetical protein